MQPQLVNRAGMVKVYRSATYGIMLKQIPFSSFVRNCIGIILITIDVTLSLSKGDIESWQSILALYPSSEPLLSGQAAQDDNLIGFDFCLPPAATKCNGVGFSVFIAII